MIQNNDNLHLSNQLFLKPQMIISIINGKYDQTPLLYSIGKTDNIKLFELFLTNLFHFIEIILNCDENNNHFGKKYFNFNKCNGYIISYNDFVEFIYVIYLCFILVTSILCVFAINCCIVVDQWGLDTKGMKVGSLKYKMVETIMKLAYFDGSNQVERRWVC